MEKLPIDTLGLLGQFLTLKEILAIATTNPNLRESLLSNEINRSLATYFGFPHGLSFVELKKYETMSYEDRLIAAIRVQDERLIDKILSFGIDKFDVVMKEVISKDDDKTAKKLIEHGAKDFHDYVYFAGREGAEKVIKLLLSIVPDEIENAISNASCEGHENIIDMLLEEGKRDPILYQSLLNQALIDAVYVSDFNQRKKLIRKLIKLGANSFQDAMIHAGFERDQEARETEALIKSLM